MAVHYCHVLNWSNPHCGTPEQAFRGIVEMDLPIVFHRRHGLIPLIRRVSARDATNWGGTVHQTRILWLIEPNRAVFLD